MDHNETRLANDTVIRQEIHRGFVYLHLRDTDDGDTFLLGEDEIVALHRHLGKVIQAHRLSTTFGEMVTLNRLQELATRTLPPPGANHWFLQPRDTLSESSVSLMAQADAIYAMRIDLLHAALGSMGEVGELIDTIKKSMMYGKPFDRANLIEEGGDTVWYIAAALCRALDITFEELCMTMIAKLEKRYPDKYTDQAAIVRADKLSEQEMSRDE